MEEYICCGSIVSSDDIKSLSLPGTYNEKISSLGTSLCGFTRLKSLDLSRNTLISTEVEFIYIFIPELTALKALNLIESEASVFTQRDVFHVLN